jgi:hypothetical protein
MGDKITIVVREDLTPGSKVVQSAHGMAEFSARHGPEFIEWTNKSNYLCYLELSKFRMELLLTRLKDLGIKFSVFLEPDIGNQMTAITIECLPEETHKKLFKNFNLTLS